MCINISNIHNPYPAPSSVMGIDMCIESPKEISEKNPLGSHSSTDVKVAHKTNKSNGIPTGYSYLIAEPSTIKLISFKNFEYLKYPTLSKDDLPLHEISPPKNIKFNASYTDNSEQESAIKMPKISRGELGRIREASNSLRGLPKAWLPELKEYQVKGLEKASTTAEKFICALGSLVWEIRNGAKYSKTIHLTNGRREESLSGEYGFLYTFLYDGDKEIFEGARIDFKSGEKQTKGSIVSMLKEKPKTIVVSLNEDFGNSIPQCSMTQDEAVLLETLKKRFEIETGKADKKIGLPVGMNINLADALLEGTSEKFNENNYEPVNTKNLNNDQAKFVKKAIRHSISFLWGPPGTGKTQTLGSVITHFYDRNEKTLVCANTNQAVDQVLLKLCKELVIQGKIEDLKEGKIVRLGRISQKELESKFSDYVTIDAIEKRKGAEIEEKIKKLESAKFKSAQMFSKHQAIINNFETLNKLRKKEAIVIKKTTHIETKINFDLRKKQHIENLIIEKDKYKKKGFLGKMFSRGIEKIYADSKKKKYRLANTGKTIITLTDELKKIIEDKPNLKMEIIAIGHLVKKQNFNTSQEVVNNEKKTISEINSDLSELRKQIKDLRKYILSQATVIGSTLTKVFLSPADLGKFQNIVIDEASMGLLPAIYFTATQSHRRCIISGDFRQLPPIIPSKNKIIFDIIGSNIFSRSGFEEIFVNKRQCAYSGVLHEQFRMDPKICNLISKIGYESELITSPNKKITTLPSPKIFQDSVIIIDTSSIDPFTDRDPFGSTSNIAHTLIARNIMREFSNIENSGSIGYCAPFKAQTKLMKKMSTGESYEKQVSIGTVHTFQGDEKETMIFDTVNSLGEKHYIHPQIAQEDASKSTLITVAISRAKNRLILIANLRYLDTKIPANGYLRKVLYNAQTTGSVIDARNVIDLVPLKEEIEKEKIKINPLNISINELKSGLVTEDTFFSLLKEDLKNAKKYIAIYSGFYTANRVNDLLPILTKKIKSGVKIRIILPPPDRNGSMSKADSNMVAEKLELAGVIVEFRARIHQKAVLIDENIAWFGSLNPLSFSGATEESMLRINQKNITGTFAANMAVNRYSAQEDPSLIVVKEVADCSFCGSKTVFHRGKYGPYLKCIKCKKTEKQNDFHS